MDDIRGQLAARMTAPGGPFAVGTAEIRSVTLQVYEDAPNDLRAVFLGAAKFGGRPAISYEDEHYTWDEYLSIVARFARILTEDFGIAKGDRVALAMRNYPEWIFSFAATVSIGAISVPLNAWWSAPELRDALLDCGAKVLIGDRERTDRVGPVRSSLPDLRAVIEVRGGADSTADARWLDLLENQPDGLDLSVVGIDTDDDCTIMYTSGTTGEPKGAVATHRSHTSNLCNMLLQTALDAEVAKHRGTAVHPPALPAALLTGPLFHIASLPMPYVAAVAGTHTVLMHRWDARRAVELIEREKITSIGGVPTVVRQLLDEIERTDRDTSSLRILRTGGAQTSSQLIERINSVFCGRVGTGTAYGLTETTGSMVGIGSRELFERPLSVGVPHPISQVRVVDARGHDVPPGELGESWFKGANIARGYWNRESQAFGEDGWFRSGDLVRRDADGFVYIVDRLKDVVIRAGENIFCGEVEDVLFSHPAVLEAAVFGVPHELWDEEVVSVVQVEPGMTLTTDDLRSYAADRLAAFKIPTTFVIGTDPLPRNAAGKVLKRELRGQYVP